MRRSIFAIISLTMALVSSCTKCKSDTAVRIGINPWPGYELLWLAHEKDLYKKHGLREEMVEYASLVDAQAAMSRGHVDVLCSTLIEVVLLADGAPAAEPPAKVILVPDFSNGADVIISKNGVRGADLKGKKIALEQGSLGEFMLKRFLDKSGLAKNEIVAVGMDQSKVEPAMLSGAVQAAITYPPISINLQKTPEMKIIFTSADIPGEVIDSVSASPKILAADPSLPEKIRAVWADALKFYREHTEEALNIMARHEKITAEDLREAMTGLSLVSSEDQNKYFGAGGSLPELLRGVQSALVAGGTIKEPKDVRALIP